MTQRAPKADSIGSLVMPCGPDCGLRPPVTREVLVATIPQALLVNGRQISDIDFNGCAPRRDFLGRYAYVSAITFRGSVNLASDDVTNDAVPGYEVASKIGAIFLRDCAGFQYVAGNLDGRSLIDDIWFRNYRLGLTGVGSGGLAANIGAAQANTVSFFLRWALTPQGAHVLSGRGLIPLAALADADPTGLQFTCQTMPNIAAYTDVTDGGFNSDMEIWAELVYLDRPMVPAAWNLNSYVRDVPDGRYNYADRVHEYLSLRPLPEDDGQSDLNAITGVTVNAGNDIIMRALTSAQWASRDTLIVARELYGITSVLNMTDANGAEAPVLGGIGPQGLPLLLGAEDSYRLILARHRGIGGMPAGVVTYNYAAFPGNDFFRYLHRTILCQQSERANNILRSMLDGCNEPMSLPGAAVDEQGRAVSVKENPTATLIALSR